MPVAIVAALIAAFAALIGVGINFLSALLGHWYTRNATVRNLLFTKQVANTEEILTKLKELVIELEKSHSEIIRICHRPSNIIEDARSSMGGAEGYPFRPDILKGKAAGIRDLSQTFVDTADQHIASSKSWIDYELVRLTTWFEETDESEELLRALFKRYSDLLNTWVSIAIEVKRWSRDNTFKLEESTLNYLESLLESPKARYSSTWREQRAIVDEAIRLQRLMASNLTGSSTSFLGFVRETLFTIKSMEVERVEGGPFVKSGFWIEKKLRELLGAGKVSGK